MILFCEECGTRHDILQENIKGDCFKFACHNCSETLFVSAADKSMGQQAQAAMMQDAKTAGKTDPGSGSGPLKVLVVDDARMIRRVICDMIRADGTKEVVGEAQNGQEALDLLEEIKPDVITLDINMPVMDGLTTLKHIMISHPTPTVMISALTQEGATETFESLKYGAIDFMPKPKTVKGGDLKSQQDEILRKIEMAAAVQIRSVRYLRRAAMDKPLAASNNLECRCVLTMAASEGGYAALLNVIPQLRPDLPATWVAVMHQAPEHIDAFSHYLNQCSQVQVMRARNGAILKGGTCYLVASQEHVLLNKHKDHMEFNIAPDRTGQQQATIDQLMTSVAEMMKTNAAGVILTGRGNDGLIGIGEILNHGGTVFIQDPRSCLFKETPVSAINAYPMGHKIGDKQMAKAMNDHINFLTH